MNSIISIFSFLDFREFLSAYIQERKIANPQFSVRSMAYRIGCNPGFFSRILKGTRNLSPELILKLGEIMKLNTKQKHYFELLVNYSQAKKQVEKDHFFRQLDLFRASKVKETTPAQHAMYAEWYYTVLRELINILPCRKNSADTMKLLARQVIPRLTPDQVRQALKTLDELGLLKCKPDGIIAAREPFITTGAEIPQVVIDRILMQFTDLARLAIDRFSRQERSLSTLTFSVSEKGFAKIREKLDQYRREILSIVNEEADPVDRVYHLNLHLFPVSKPNKGFTR
jgi:uncharacterized protein (TIGR02147 family)